MAWLENAKNTGSQKIDVVCGPSKQWEMEEEAALSNDESHAMQEVLTSLDSEVSKHIK